MNTFAQECFNDDDLRLTLTFYGKVKFAFLAFILNEFMELVEDFCANVKNIIIK